MSTTSFCDTTKEIVENILKKARSFHHLPDGGRLFLEHDIPYLFIGRTTDNSEQLERLVKSGASYLIIANENQFNYKELLLEISSALSAKFGNYLLIEFYEGVMDDLEFIIQGPSHKLPATLDILKQELENIDSRRFGNRLTAKIENTKDRHPNQKPSLVEIEEAKYAGATLLGISIPPVYKNAQGEQFPVYFRKFRNEFFKAVQQGIFEFIRVQTSCGMLSYKALGKRDIHKNLLEIDREITAIQSGYQFLLLVAPVNIQSIRSKFFESQYQVLEDYHYRLLPIDPDVLKRKLYNLKIEDIDDPAMAHLYDEKRVEIEHELTMLKERNSKNFLYSSVRMYGVVEEELLKEAKNILNTIEENLVEDESRPITALEFKKMAEEEFKYFRKQASGFDCKVHVREDVNIIMVSRGELYLPSDYTMTKQDANALIQHEIGTHVLTYYNGRQQPLSQLAIGLADYDALQEGIAVLSEFLTGSLSSNRLRILAGRVVAGAALMKGANFKEVFQLLLVKYHFTQDRAFNITSRMFQGGGFLKDIIYLKGLKQLKTYLKNGGDLKKLLSGKFALKHVEIINELTERTILKPTTLQPRYFDLPQLEKQLNKFINGHTLANMIRE